LKGAKETMDGLRAYLGRALAEAVRPSIERVLEDATSTDFALEELYGESFQDDVSEFVESDIEEIVSYRTMGHARDCWSKWAKRTSWGVFGWLVLEIGFTSFFALWTKVFSRPVGLPVLMGTFGASAAVVIYCLVCAGAMLFYHDQISSYRDKIL
jgi:hypothetical protein